MDELIEFLKNENTRIEYGYRWLVMHEDNVINVYSRRPGKRVTICEYEGTDMAEAVRILKGDE